VDTGSIHVNTAWVVVALNTVAAIWAFVAHRVDRARGRPLWIVTAIAQVSVLVQVTLGVIALQADGVEATDTHTFYGFLTIASVGIIYSYRQQIMEWQYLLYGFGGLFIAGLGIRAIYLTPA
jgi:hypothetical protein